MIFEWKMVNRSKIVGPGIDISDRLYYDVQLLKENLQECPFIKEIKRLFLHNNYRYLYPRLYRTYVRCS